MNKLNMDCQIKTVSGTRKFTAYGNVKNVEDLAGDVALDGCYAESIKIHKQKGTAPILFWGQKHDSLPIGGIDTFEEDSKGFLIEGDFAPTTMGKDIEILAERGDIKMLSMGYNVLDEMYDAKKNVNYLKSVHVKEVSFVNFACNEDSVMVSIKSQMAEGILPSVREIERLLRDGGMSRKQAMAICSAYKPKTEKAKFDLAELQRYTLFK